MYIKPNQGSHYNANVIIHSEMYTFLEPWRHYKMLDQSGIHPKTYMHTMCLSTFRHDGCCYKNHMQHARFKESITLSFSNKRTMLYLEGNDAWKGVLGVEHCSEKQGEGDWVYIHSVKDAALIPFTLLGCINIKAIVQHLLDWMLWCIYVCGTLLHDCRSCVINILARKIGLL